MCQREISQSALYDGLAHIFYYRTLNCEFMDLEGKMHGEPVIDSRKTIPDTMNNGEISRIKDNELRKIIQIKTSQITKY